MREPRRQLAELSPAQREQALQHYRILRPHLVVTDSDVGWSACAVVVDGDHHHPGQQQVFAGEAQESPEDR